jgi:hypothetical protein
VRSYTFYATCRLRHTWCWDFKYLQDSCIHYIAYYCPSNHKVRMEENARYRQINKWILCCRGDTTIRWSSLFQNVYCSEWRRRPSANEHFTFTLDIKVKQTKRHIALVTSDKWHVFSEENFPVTLHTIHVHATKCHSLYI